MKKSLLVFALVAAAMWAASPGSQAQDSQPTQSFLKTLGDKVSYTLGYQLAKGFGSEVDFKMMKRGYDDAVAKKKSPMTETEMRSAMQEFQKQAADRDAKANQTAGEAFLAANKGKEGVVTLPSGLQYKVMQRGTGASPAATDEVTVHYHGTLITGEVFDSSVERGQPATFPLNRVIKGWTEGLQLMKTGGKWTFYIPSDLAYGPQRRSEKIGPNSTLVFEVELKSIKGK